MEAESDPAREAIGWSLQEVEDPRRETGVFFHAGLSVCSTSNAHDLWIGLGPAEPSSYAVREPLKGAGVPGGRTPPAFRVGRATPCAREG